MTGYLSKNSRAKRTTRRHLRIERLESRMLFSATAWEGAALDAAILTDVTMHSARNMESPASSAEVAYVAPRDIAVEQMQSARKTESPAESAEVTSVASLDIAVAQETLLEGTYETVVAFDQPGSKSSEYREDTSLLASKTVIDQRSGSSKAFLAATRGRTVTHSDAQASDVLRDTQTNHYTTANRGRWGTAELSTKPSSANSERSRKLQGGFLANMERLGSNDWNSSGTVEISTSLENGFVTVDVAWESLPSLPGLVEGTALAPPTQGTELAYGDCGWPSLFSDLARTIGLTFGTPQENGLKDSSPQNVESLPGVLSTAFEHTNGGLVDINHSTRTVPEMAAPLSWQSPEPSAAWKPRDHDNQTLDDETVSQDGDEALRHTGALVDITLDSSFSSGEGGMIDLAIVLPEDRDLQERPVSTPTREQDIQMDKSLDRYQAFEIAAAPSEALEALPLDVTASTDAQDNGESEASTSAATEPHSESDRHAAVPTIVAISLITGIDRKRIERRS